MEKRKYVHSALRKKILYSNALMTGLLCTVAFVAFSAYYFVQQNLQFIESATTTAQTKFALFEQMITLANNTGTQITLNAGVVEIFKERNQDTNPENYFLYEPYELQYIYENALPYLVKQSYVSRICLYNDKGDLALVGPTNSYIGNDDYLDQEKLAFLQNAFAETSIVYQVYDTQPDEGGVSGSGYICMVQCIKDYTVLSKPIVGYVEVQIDIPNIMEFISGADAEQYITLAYQDEVFWAAGEQADYGTRNVAECIVDGFRFTICQYNVVGLRMTVQTILLLLVVCVFVVIELYYLQRRSIREITAPVIELCRTIQYSNIAEISVFGEEEFDEIQNLNESFVIMLQKLQQSVDELVIERTSKLNAQMLALQAQVNPHFIHNTLAIISSLIDDGENEKARVATNKLSAIIRYSANYTNKKEWLQKELNYISDYLAIVKLKYEEDFSFEIVAQDATQVLEQEIPKFVLQPLVENAIQHSLKQARFPWHIQLSYLSNQTGWLVAIADNGVGIRPEKIEDIKARRAQISDANVEELLSQLEIGGYSLMNTLIRMHLTYRENTVFNIAENEQGGTTVSIGFEKRGGEVND